MNDNGNNNNKKAVKNKNLTMVSPQLPTKIITDNNTKINNIISGIKNERTILKKVA
jgi:hypothetical protein